MEKINHFIDFTDFHKMLYVVNECKFLGVCMHKNIMSIILSEEHCSKEWATIWLKAELQSSTNFPQMSLLRRHSICFHAHLEQVKICGLHPYLYKLALLLYNALQKRIPSIGYNKQRSTQRHVYQPPSKEMLPSNWVS